MAFQILATPFCDPDYVSLVGVKSASFASLTSDEKQAACDAANGLVGAALNGRYPGIGAANSGYAWGPEVSLQAVYIAQKIMLDKRGRTPNPASPDKLVDDNYKLAMDWIKGVQTQAIHPNITGGEQAGRTSQGPAILSTSADRTNSSCRGRNRGI